MFYISDFWIDDRPAVSIIQEFLRGISTANTHFYWIMHDKQVCHFL